MQPPIQRPPIQWPTEQLFVAPKAAQIAHAACAKPFRELCDNLRIDADLEPWIEALYIPTAAWLQRKRNQLQRPMVVGLTGGQGSGKSTVSALLALVLREAFQANAVALSIDDIYMTHAERQQRGREVHPLLATRGPPGTHDAEMGLATIDQLLAQTPEQSTQVPAFDKATDDRRPQSEWPTHAGHVDFVLFEGWCVGAKPQLSTELQTPINALEREEDADALWRQTVNQELSDTYQALFARIDAQILLRIDSMERVFEWRQLQERKLRDQIQRDGPSDKPMRVMTEQEVNRFIEHYERITRHLLGEMPGRADIVLDIDTNHNPANVRINRPLT